MRSEGSSQAINQSIKQAERQASKYANKPPSEEAGKKASTEFSTHGGQKVNEKQTSTEARKYTPRAGLPTSKQSLKLANNQAKIQTGRWETKQESKGPIKQESKQGSKESTAYTVGEQECK